jgi:hypothetical protein
MNNLANNANTRPTDWRILLPRAFFLNWSDSKTWQKSAMDPTIWFPLAFYPQEEQERTLELMQLAVDMAGKDKAGEKQAVKQFFYNHYGDIVGNDKSGGSIMKDNKSGRNMAGGNMADGDKKNAIKDPDETMKVNNE